MARARDSQRSKVYKAERAIDVWNSPTMTIAECRERVEKITKSATWEKLYPHWDKSIDVKDGRGTRHAKGSGSFISLPKWARTEIIILHELAHSVVCVQDSNIIKHEAGHGRLFVRTYLKLVRRFMGKDVHDELKASFKKYKVKYNRMRDKSKMLNSISMNGVGDVTVSIKYQFWAEDYNETWEVFVLDNETNETRGRTLEAHRLNYAKAEYHQRIGELYLEGFR